MAYPTLADLLRGLFGIDIWLPVPTFGLLVGIAFFVGLKLAGREAQRLNQDPEVMLNACVWGFFSGLVGARLFHILEYPREFLADPMAMLLSRSGFTIFGGLIVGLVVSLLYCRRKHARIPVMLDAGAPALMLAYAIGRIGCQISGDGDWGIAADLSAKPGWLPTWLWAQMYTGNVAGIAARIRGALDAAKTCASGRLAVRGLCAARGCGTAAHRVHSREHHLRSLRIRRDPGADHLRAVHRGRYRRHDLAFAAGLRRSAPAGVVKYGHRRILWPSRGGPSR
jgi:hypothetical protein